MDLDCVWARAPIQLYAYIIDIQKSDLFIRNIYCFLFVYVSLLFHP